MSCQHTGAGLTLPRNPMRMKLGILLAVFVSLALSSCNTVAGLGQDVQRAGEGLENTGEGRTW